MALTVTTSDILLLNFFPKAGLLKTNRQFPEEAFYFPD